MSENLEKIQRDEQKKERLSSRSRKDISRLQLIIVYSSKKTINFNFRIMAERAVTTLVENEKTKI